MKTFSYVVGFIGAAIAYCLGGWSSGIITLVVFMCIDYVTGFIVAAVFKQSNKTESGSLSSAVGLKGICKKFVMLLIVAVSHRLDLLVDTTYIRDFVVIAFCCNELVSITENAGLMGLPIPAVILNAIDVLKSKDNSDLF